MFFNVYSAGRFIGQVFAGCHDTATEVVYRPWRLDDTRVEIA